MKNLICLFSITFLLFHTVHLLAQPANDNVCDALEIQLDSAAVVVSNVGATVEVGEQSIVPSGPPLCSTCFYGIEAWYDTSGPDGGPAFNHSLWFKFIAPSTTAVKIVFDGSTFNPQVALFQAEDCADFGSYTLIRALDTLRHCGNNDCFEFISIECLQPDATYLLVVDDWQADASNPVDTGEVKIFISTEEPISPGLAKTNGINVKNPSCPGASDGFIGISIISGVLPLEFLWSHGAATEDAVNIPAGDYTVTVTDFCGETFYCNYEIEDPSVFAPLVIGDFPIEVVSPSRCGDDPHGGQIMVTAGEADTPYSYLWSTGDTTALIRDLTDGTYTVTITDGCGIESAVKTFYVGMDAGSDFDFEMDCQAVPIGLDHSFSGGATRKISYNTDQSLMEGIACRGNYIASSATWRSFDLANDFGISELINLHAVEVFITSDQGNRDFGVPVRFTAYQANTPLLDAVDLQLTELNQLATFIPTIAEYTPFLIPLEVDDFSPSDILVIKVETLPSSSSRQRFDFAANLSPTTQTTYITSTDCNIDDPISLDSLGFDHEIVMNLYLADGGALTYQWEGPVDDPTSPTPIALGTELENIYKVTITDEACGITLTDEVVITCAWANSTNELKATSFTVSPNPSTGHFQLLGEGALQETECMIYNTHGQKIKSQRAALGYGNVLEFDLSGFPKGIYWLSIATAEGGFVKRLLVQ